MRVVRFLLPLGLLLALLTVVTAWLVESTSQRWFRKDVELRAQLALRGTRDLLDHALDERQPQQIAGVLRSITRDERIMAAAVCTAEHGPFAATDGFPAEYGCERAAGWTSRHGADAVVSTTGTLEREPVLVTAVRLGDAEHPRGYALMVHDMSYAERRAGLTRWFFLAALGLLAVAASAVTILLIRVYWRRWTDEVRRALRGDSARREFRPLLADLRDLATRLAEDKLEGDTSRWGPDRLRRVVLDHLQGERVLIVANREPYIHERRASGAIDVLHPASGLVTALEPVMRTCAGTWIAHGSGSADRETVDAKDRLRVPPGAEAYSLRRVWLSKREEAGYYYGFANEGLWPLCHVAHNRPLFRADDWRDYNTVNKRFADAVVEEAEHPDPVVLVQDYHFAVAPAYIRERLPRATIATFWHIPWPNAERFGICPWRRELLEGMLGSSILGFHTQGHCNNFLDAVDRYLEARIDRETQGVVHKGRMTLVRPYPISVEWPNHWAATAPPIEECQRSVRAELGLAPDAILGVGVDRLDYTKGIEERMLAVERLIERWPQLVGRFTFVQLAAPSRTVIERYRSLNESIEALVERINGRFAKGSWRPIILQREHHEPPKVFRYYRAANVCYVSSLHDGMNLVAKEFVAARDDEQGVLVLSSFTGAARELTEALVVNPYDIEEASSALRAAVVMPKEEQAARMRAMRELVAEFNVYRWAGRMLIDAARLRRRERVGLEERAA